MTDVVTQFGSVAGKLPGLPAGISERVIAR
jgi:hypothetical protein